MPTQLLPTPERLRAVLSDPEEPVELLCLLRTDGDPRAALRERLGELGGAVTWVARNELLAIGDGELHWTHTVLARIERGNRLIAAAEAGGVEVDAAELQMHVYRPRRPPAVVLRLLRLLRPIGRLFEGGEDGLAEFTMGLEEGGIHPRRDQIARIAASTRDTPAYMINLLHYRERAEYRLPVRRPNVSGRRAYERYGLVALRSVYMLGGEVVHIGQLGAPLVEGAHTAAAGRWDDLAIVRYPSVSRLLKLTRMPGYPHSMRHREAGLDRTALIVSELLG